MDPRDASVYTDTWSPLTWVLILSVIIVFVMTLMVAFIALVHHSIEHSADLPRERALPGPAATTTTAGTAPQGASHPPRAA